MLYYSHNIINRSKNKARMKVKIMACKYLLNILFCMCSSSRMCSCERKTDHGESNRVLAKHNRIGRIVQQEISHQWHKVEKICGFIDIVLTSFLEHWHDYIQLHNYNLIHCVVAKYKVSPAILWFTA
jgi:hypothetical protein